MDAHRYWRIDAVCRLLSGSFVFGLVEMECRAVPGGANLCTGGTPLAPQASDPGADIANAFDGSASTLYGRNGNTFITPAYDFGSAVNVGEVRLKFGASGSARPGSTHSPAATVVQWSDDGVLWRSMAPYLDLTDIGDGGEAVFLLATPAVPILAAAPVRVVGAAASGPVGGSATPAAWRHDAQDGGRYRVAGTVKIDGTPATPVRRRVRLFDVVSGRLVREAWSAADGAFAFERIRDGEYLVVSDDHTRLYNAVVADRVSAVP